MKTPIDEHGQPFNLKFNAYRRLERNISELLGLAKGIISDGNITEQEVNFINDWMGIHKETVKEWPCSIIFNRLEKILKDNLISMEERDDLRELLADLVGGKSGIIGNQDTASKLPFDIPFPNIILKNKVFVLTGKFAFGPRAACIKFTEGAGGICEDSVSHRTNYLIIGTFGSRDWVHTSIGRKIEKAVNYKSSGQELFIVGEDHWAESLPNE